MRTTLSLILLLMGQPLFANTPIIHHSTLKNGLDILIKEDHRAPVASFMVWYHVGSADEVSGKTGLAHALEHMMFKGTPKYPQGVFSKTVAELGGQENAFTNTDYTAYFENIASDKLKTCFELEADRMNNLNLTPEEFSKEIKVIQEERRMRTDDNPQALAFERFLAAAHLTMPYHHPVIGWMSDLEHMTVTDTQNWYNNYYAPNNATLVIVGDVDPKKMIALAESTFGNITKQTTLYQAKQIEPKGLGPKQVTIYDRAKLPLLITGYLTPSIPSSKTPKDAYTLELIATLLGGSDNGRLTKSLVKTKHIASSVEVSYDLYSKYQTQFVILGIPSNPEQLENLQTAFEDEIHSLQNNLVPEVELARIKTQLIAQKTFEKDSVFGQAMILGTLATAGLPYETDNDYLKEIEKITASDIQTVAKQYFVPNQLTIAKLYPNADMKPKQG